MSTVAISEHARQRCAEMKISTKVAKRIARHPDLTLPGGAAHPPGRRMVWSRLEPEYAVILCGEGLVVTVIYWSPDAPVVRPVAS